MANETELCVVALEDSTSLRAPAYPADCAWVGRAYATGELYKIVTAEDLATETAKRLCYLLGDTSVPVVDSGYSGYGRELVNTLSDGRELRCPAEPCGGFWVRIVSAEGEEEVYWDEDEFRDDPEVVLGALIGAACVHTEIVRDA